MLHNFFNNHSYSLAKHTQHLSESILEMETSTIAPSNESDQKNAENQLNFAKATLNYLNKMLALSSLDFVKKKVIGEKMSKLTKEYFGDDEIPLITGPLSKSFALIIAKHYHGFTKVEFSKIEIEASISASKINSLCIRSIPDQIKHHRQLAISIEAQIQIYENKKTYTNSI